MLVDHVHAPFLGCGALALAVFDEAGIGALPAFSSHGGERVMALFDVHTKEMLRREVLPALETTVHVRLGVVSFEFVIGGKGEALFVRWE